MGADAPQWLFSSFVDAMQEIGASAPIPVLEAEARDLISRWNARGRFLHNTRHLLKTLSRIDEIASTAHDPDVLRVALWYQGAVLNRSFDIFRRGETGDEQEFASLYHARSRMETLGVSEDVISRIQELMMALFTHRADPSDMDAQVLIDADLGMLAASPQDFKRFREALRQECTDLCDLEFFRARRLAIRKILKREQIFHSPLAIGWEETARANLEAESTKLTRLLKDAEAAGEITDSDDDFDVEDGPQETSLDTPASGTMIIRRRHLNIKNHTQPFDRVDEGLSAPSLPYAVVELPESKIALTSEDLSTDEAASQETPQVQPTGDLGGVSSLSDAPTGSLPVDATPTDTTLAGDATVSAAAVDSAQDDATEASTTPLAGVPTVERTLAPAASTRGSEMAPKNAADEDDTSSLESAIEDLDIPAPPPLS